MTRLKPRPSVSLFIIYISVYVLKNTRQQSISSAGIKKNAGKNVVDELWRFPCQRQSYLNTLRPRQNGRHFPDDIFRCIFLNENISISITISWKFVPKGSINNIPALVLIMARRRLGDKPLSEAMMVNLPTHICVTRPQWVNGNLHM